MTMETSTLEQTTVPANRGGVEATPIELGQHALIWAGMTSQYGMDTPLGTAEHFGHYVQCFVDLGYDEEWILHHIAVVEEWDRQGRPAPTAPFAMPDGYDEEQVNVHAFAHMFPEQMNDPNALLGAIAFSACHTKLQVGLVKTCHERPFDADDAERRTADIKHRTDYIREETAYGRRARAQLGRILRAEDSWIAQVADELMAWQAEAWQACEAMGYGLPFVHWNGCGDTAQSDPETFTYPIRPENVTEPLIALAATATHTVAVAVFRRRIAENVEALENTSDPQQIDALTSECLRFSGYGRADAERMMEHRARLEEVAYDGVSGLGPEIRKAARILDSWLFELTNPA